MNNTAKTTILALAIIGAAIMSGCLGGDPVATTNYVQPSTTIEQATPQESNDLELQLNETAHDKHTIVSVHSPSKFVFMGILRNGRRHIGTSRKSIHIRICWNREHGIGSRLPRCNGLQSNRFK